MKLRDFARHLQLSPSTVSRALNGYSDVSARTRARVKREAARLGYVPHPAGLKLRTGRTDMIGVVLPRPQVQFATPFFLDVLAGIDDALRETRYELIVTAGRDGADEVETVRRMVEGRRVDGIIFGRTRARDPRISYLLDAKFPFVALGRSQHARPFAWLDIDHETSGRLACERLAARGHRRIALINTPEHFNYSRVCAEGFAHGARATAERQRIVAAGLAEADGFAAMASLLRQPKRPSAVVCGNDMLAFGAMRAIRAAGLRPGRDIALIGCDDHPLAASADPPLTTFAAPIREAGARVARMLLELMDGGAAAELQELWQPSLIDRESDPAPARAQEVA